MFLRPRHESHVHLPGLGERESQLWRMCEEALRGVRVQRPFTIESFCEALSAQRGRRLVLRELPESDGLRLPCGLWVAYPDEDHIWHVTATSQRHRLQVIFHEIAHMLLNHKGDSGVSALLAALPPEIAPTRVRAVFGRTNYSTDQEHDAELTATILGEIVDRLPTAPSTSHHGLLDRVDATMVHPRRNCR
ncbi:secondary metabolite protein [Streptomyces sp. NPDC001795]|uniref:secondary metabolite protein n=1 Tax=Streptomyces sp. NPDC001795 TaxID=3154525 RepID=UPI00332B9282